MSSTNITQGDNKEVITTADGQTSHQNNSEQQSTSTAIKAEVKVTVIHEISEEPVTSSNSLSSLDELEARLKEQFQNKSTDQAIVVNRSENLNIETEKPENIEMKISNALEEQILIDETVSKNHESKVVDYTGSFISPVKSLDVTYNGVDNAQATTSRITSDPSICTITISETSKCSLKELMHKEIQDEDSFVTVEGSVKEKMTGTDIPTLFSPDNRTQQAIIARDSYTNRAPPPYEYFPRPQYQAQYQYQSTPVPLYQASYTGYPPPPPPPRNTSMAPAYRRTHFEDMEDLFQNKQIRNQFVRKVYMILSLQLLFSFGLIALCVFEKTVKSYVLRLWPLMIVAMIVYFILMIVLFCYQQARRSFPTNFVLLSLMTLALAYLTAAISCMYDTYIVLLTMGVTAGICILVSLLACQHWFDVTQWGIILCLAGIVIIIYGIIALIIAIITGSYVAYIIYSCLITILFCVYLMYDTQQILGGRRIEMSPEEYILGAITLYVDIMIIFQHMLFLISLCR